MYKTRISLCFCANFQKLKNKNSIHWNLKKAQQRWISFFVKLRKAQKIWISFLSNFKKLKKHTDLHFFSDWIIPSTDAWNFRLLRCLRFVLIPCSCCRCRSTIKQHPGTTESNSNHAFQRIYLSMYTKYDFSLNFDHSIFL